MLNKINFIENLKTLLYALIIALIIRSILIQPFYIPSSSMEPSLLVGDRIFVSKYSYGFSRHSFPFSPNVIFKRIYLLFMTHFRCLRPVWHDVSNFHFFFVFSDFPTCLLDSLIFYAFCSFFKLILLAKFAKSLEFGIEIINLLSIKWSCFFNFF